MTQPRGVRSRRRGRQTAPAGAPQVGLAVDRVDQRAVGDDVLVDAVEDLVRPHAGLVDAADQREVHVRGERGRAAGAGDPLVGEGELERRGAETAALPRNGEPEIPRLVHLAEVLEREGAVAVDALGAGGERPGQRIGEGDQLRLALGPGKGIVHAMR